MANEVLTGLLACLQKNNLKRKMFASHDARRNKKITARDK
jgi:hypothetical protein